MRCLSVALLCLGIAGCGTSAHNADVPAGVYTGLAGKPDIGDTSRVAVVPTGPSIEQGGKAVSGTSCKNKVWEPAPSEENAIALMKREAEGLSLNAVHSVSVDPDATALLKNCWSAVVAKGIAFKR